MVWFISDMHFGHKNLCEGLRNMTSEESDELIISNWNKYISKKDKVFILGDIVMEKPKLVMTYLNRLKGVKEVILGNHDIKVAKVLVENGIIVNGSRFYKDYWLSHMPIHPSQLDYAKGNIHGHIHIPEFIEGLGEYKPQVDLGPKYYNVNVEFHEYKPTSFDEIETYFSKLSS